MGEGISIRVIRTTEEVEDIRTVWTSWQHHPNADIDFYLTVNRLRPQVLRPHIIMLYRDGRPDAVLVGRIVEERIAFKVGYKTIFRPEARLLRITCGGLLGNLSSENSEAIVKEITNSLYRGDADAAVLGHVEVGSPMYTAATRSPSFLRRDLFPTLDAHWTMRLPSSMEEYYSGLSAKARRNRRQEAQRLLRDFSGRVKVSCFRRTTELEPMIQDVEEIAKRTYHRGLGVGFVDGAETRQRLQLAAQNGWLRAYILYVADRPCAFWIGTQYRRTVYGDFTGYDPSYRKYSPGIFLLLRIIEDLCNDGVKEIDFGIGDAWYKQYFCNYEWQEASVYLFAPTLRGLKINALRTSTNLIDQLAKRALKGVNVLARVKKVWRDRLSGAQR